MIRQSLSKLEYWIQENGWEGYDPYDIKGENQFLLFSRWKYSNFIINRYLELFPLFNRNIFKIKKEINPKAIGLFTRAYLYLYKKTTQDIYLTKAIECLDWLEKNSCNGYHGFCWGYPFNWQSRILIPKGTPSGVVTTTIAQAFLDAYETLKNDKYLKIAESSCDFIINDLNIDMVDHDKLCFSYTPLDSYHVHNANLLSASELI